MVLAVSTSNELVPLALDACPACGGAEPAALVIEEPALLWHGGYGETRATTLLLCPCGWELVRAIDSTRPLEGRSGGGR